MYTRVAQYRHKYNTLYSPNEMHILYTTEAHRTQKRWRCPQNTAKTESDIMYAIEIKLNKESLFI